MKKIADFFKLLLLIVVLALGTGLLARYSSEEIAGRVRVIDGDSIEVAGREIRLMGLDAPEYRQECLSASQQGKPYLCGQAAAKHLQRLVDGKEVVCHGNEEDKYARLLAICKAGTINLNAVMVEHGWAVSFGDYEWEEREARRNARGLWAGEFSLPSDWRRSRNEKTGSGWLSGLIRG